MQFPDETPFRVSGGATVWHLDRLFLIGDFPSTVICWTPLTRRLYNWVWLRAEVILPAAVQCSVDFRVRKAPPKQAGKCGTIDPIRVKLVQVLTLGFRVAKEKSTHRAGAKKRVNQLICGWGKYLSDKIGSFLVIALRISMDWNQLCPTAPNRFC